MTDADLSLDSNVCVVVISPGGLRVERVSNVTCVGGHEAVAELLAGGRPTVDSVALGNDGGAGTDTANRSLNNQLDTVAVNSLDASGATTTIRAFVPSLLQLGSTADPVDEVGAVVSNGDLLNHATIPDVDLSGPDTVLVIDITITITDT